VNCILASVALLALTVAGTAAAAATIDLPPPPCPTSAIHLVLCDISTTAARFDTTCDAGLSATWTDVPTGASMTATLGLNGATVATATQSRDCSYNGCSDTGSLALPLTAVVTVSAGEPFEVTAGLSGSAFGNIINPASADAAAVFALDDVPPGTHLVSCHDAATPALRGTWSALKIRYR
jgi:hypothetical protein